MPDMSALTVRVQVRRTVATAFWRVCTNLAALCGHERLYRACGLRFLRSLRLRVGGRRWGRIRADLAERVTGGTRQ